ncbi:hypothetical protein [Nonomuraea basaltis]|uniref:hypothetical protein n=1 Tax=Nonomuraea basaltis TaxID=2495887 RepID=UPI00110C4AA6|nr:hypothetical protein [Nonomuraea basaltis]TMR91292.1 hypothetical protein EJK15_50775 [Nonomuraea basaltis]
MLADAAFVYQLAPSGPALRRTLSDVLLLDRVALGDSHPEGRLTSQQAERWASEEAHRLIDAVRVNTHAIERVTAGA